MAAAGIFAAVLFSFSTSCKVWCARLRSAQLADSCADLVCTPELRRPRGRTCGAVALHYCCWASDPMRSQQPIQMRSQQLRMTRETNMRQLIQISTHNLATTGWKSAVTPRNGRRLPLARCLTPRRPKSSNSQVTQMLRLLSRSRPTNCSCGKTKRDLILFG